MADEPLFANVTVHYKMHGDPRFRALAELGGWTLGDACWRMVTLWARCTAQRTDRPTVREVRVHLGPRGDELLIETGLAERVDDGVVRLAGAGLTGGDTDRFGWYSPLEARQRKAGKARSDAAARDARGRMLPAGAGAGAQPPAGHPASPAGIPAASSQPSSRPAQAGPAYQPPDSGFRIPEDQKLSPARAIPPIPEPRSDWHDRLRWWAAMLSADARVRAAGIEPNAPQLGKSPAGENEKNMAACARQFSFEGFSPSEVDAKMVHIVAVAEAECMRDRKRMYLIPAVLWDPKRANRSADTSLEEARRSRTNGKGGATSLPSPVKRPDRGPLLPTASAEERAASAEMARAAAAANFATTKPEDP